MLTQLLADSIQDAAGNFTALNPAAAELFSRLRKELAEEPQMEHAEGKGKKKAA